MTPKYLRKAVETYNFHREKLMIQASWRVSDTARALRRSIGGVSEDLKIVRAYKEFPQIEKITTAADALKFIRDYKKQTDTDEI